MRSMAEATCSRMARVGRSMPAISTIVSRRASASRGELACTVEMRALVAGVHGLEHVERLAAADLADDDPVGSHAQRVAHQVADGDLALALDVGRTASSRTTWCWRSCSSTASSMVTTRSLSGMNDESTLSSVVLPVPVPPVTRMLSLPATQACEQVGGRGRQASRT